MITSAELHETPNNTLIELAGMAIARQRPATANGIVFMLLEDEHGQANLIIPPNVYEQHRAIIRGEPLLLARGKLERHDRNVNLLVASVESLGPLARQGCERGGGDERTPARASLRSPLSGELRRRPTRRQASPRSRPRSTPLLRRTKARRAHERARSRT